MNAAKELGADLLVIGSQGRRGLPRFVMGSTAEHVVRTAPVPVLTVHPYDDVAILAGGMDTFRHILAPTDLSESARHGVDMAAGLAQELDAKLTLVHSFERPMSEYYGTFLPHEDLESESRRQLDALVTTVRERIPHAKGVFAEGAPWKAILDVAKQHGADLVVLSTHRRRGLPRVLIGSVAEKIVRLATTPVLTVGHAHSQTWTRPDPI